MRLFNFICLQFNNSCRWKCTRFLFLLFQSLRYQIGSCSCLCMFLGNWLINTYPFSMTKFIRVLILLLWTLLLLVVSWWPESSSVLWPSTCFHIRFNFHVSLKEAKFQSSLMLITFCEVHHWAIIPDTRTHLCGNHMLEWWCNCWSHLLRTFTR